MSPAPDHVEGDLGMPRQVDVVVIGGGIIGCASALELAQKGLRVALCERAASPANNPAAIGVSVASRDATRPNCR